MVLFNKNRSAFVTNIFGSPINRDPPKADKSLPHGIGGQVRFAAPKSNAFTLRFGHKFIDIAFFLS